MIHEGQRTCPNCNGQLIYRDTVKRLLREDNGTKKQIKVDRYVCTNCRRVHRELPNIVVPYKHYSREIIEKVRSGEITPETLGYEDFPSEMTMERWKSQKKLVIL